MRVEFLEEVRVRGGVIPKGSTRVGHPGLFARLIDQGIARELVRESELAGEPTTPQRDDPLNPAAAPKQKRAGRRGGDQAGRKG